MECENLEELLESVFDDEPQDINLSENTPLPCKLRWIVSDGSFVTEDQIVAILTPSKIEYRIKDSEQDDIERQMNRNSNYDSYDNMGDVAHKNLIVKSTKNGKLVRMVRNLTEVDSRDEPIGRIEAWHCNHEVVVHGLCANCSASVEPGGLKRKLDDLSHNTASKLLPGFITNHAGVEVDAELAYEMECSEISKYLEDRKLCLVLDLDNTLVHATSQKAPIDIDIDTIELADTDLADALKHVQYASEDDEEAMKIQKRLETSVIKTIVYNEAETTYCTSYFKLRPGIFNFFRKVSRKYKFFLFTMGTRQHALSALQILDPQGQYFGNRIFCRNDSRSCMKSLDRIFPKHKNLVLVMDDSEYVWTNNLGLIKVHPYYFFSDLTYLNNYDLNNLMRSSAALQSICNYSNFIWSKLIHTSNNNTGGTDDTIPNEPNKVDKDGFAIPTAIRKPQFRYNGYLICNERPQNIYSKNVVVKNGASAKRDNGDVFKMIHLKDNDRQLEKLIKLLDQIYTQFYQQYDRVVEKVLAEEAENNRQSEDNVEGEDTGEGLTKEGPGEAKNWANEGQAGSAPDMDPAPNPAHPASNLNVSDATSGSGSLNANGLNSSESDDSDLKTETDGSTSGTAEGTTPDLEAQLNTGSSSRTSNGSPTSSPTKAKTNKPKVDIEYLLGRNLLPRASVILTKLRESILKNVKLFSNTVEFINLTPSASHSPLTEHERNTINFLVCSDFGKWAVKFGASVSSRLHSVTHVVVNNRNSLVLPHGIAAKKVHIKWLEAVVYSYEHVDEDKFNPDLWRVPFRSFWDVLSA